MKFCRFIIVALFLFTSIYSQSNNQITLAKQDVIHSKIMGEDRPVIIYTPQNYEQSSQSYPVLYVLDGSVNTIHYVSAITNYLSSVRRSPEMIVVAIPNINRNRDLTPTKSNLNAMKEEIERRGEWGEADKFLSFIEKELFSYIETNYRTQPYRIFVGHSFGGLCVTHAFLNHNEMFNAFVAISPSLWWDDEILNRTAVDKLKGMNLANKYYYYSVGADENPVIVKDAHTFFGTLKNHAPQELTWKFDYLQNEDHGSQGMAALYSGLKNLYDGWSLQYPDVIAGGLEFVLNHYKKLSDKMGYEIKPTENDINTFGYWMVRVQNHDEAIKFCEYNVKLHPESSNVYDSLGEALEAKGDLNGALNNYKMAIEKNGDATETNKEVYQEHYDSLLKKLEEKN